MSSLRCRMLLGSFAVFLSSWAASPAAALPWGTQYTASVVNLPGTDTAVLEFDGLEEPLGSSGLLVGEMATQFVDFVLIELSLHPADGNPFVGQQIAPLETASASATGLHLYGDPTPLRMLADSAFLWLSIGGIAQPLSDVGGLGLRFYTHPLNPSIPVLLIDNIATTEFSFETSGATLFDAFAALVGPEQASLIDGLHLGVAAVPVPEPATALLVLGGLLGISASRHAVRRAKEAA